MDKYRCCIVDGINPRVFIDGKKHSIENMNKLYEAIAANCLVFLDNQIEHKDKRIIIKITKEK